MRKESKHNVKENHKSTREEKKRLRKEVEWTRNIKDGERSLIAFTCVAGNSTKSIIS